LFWRRAGLREILFCGFWKSTSLSSVGLELSRYLELLDTVEIIEEDNHNEN
jgi:hypothetical protein